MKALAALAIALAALVALKLLAGDTSHAAALLADVPGTLCAAGAAIGSLYTVLSLIHI